MTKKKKILLGTLIPLSVCIVGTAVAVPLLLKSCNEGWITLESSNDVKNYLEKHKIIHDETHDWSRQPNNYEEMCTWFWDRNNLGSQNMVNGILVDYYTDSSRWDMGITRIKVHVAKNDFKLFVNAYMEGRDITVNMNISWTQNIGLIHCSLYDSSRDWHTDTNLINIEYISAESDWKGNISYLTSDGLHIDMSSIWFGDGAEYPNIKLPEPSIQEY